MVVGQSVGLLTEDTSISNVISTVLHFGIAEPITVQVIVTITARALVPARSSLVTSFQDSLNVSSIDQHQCSDDCALGLVVELHDGQEHPVESVVDNVVGGCIRGLSCQYLPDSRRYQIVRVSSEESGLTDHEPSALLGLLDVNRRSIFDG